LNGGGDLGLAGVVYSLTGSVGYLMLTLHLGKTPPRLATYQRAGSVYYYCDSLVNIRTGIGDIYDDDTEKALVPKSATEKEGSYWFFYYFGKKSIIFIFL
jgi:hypothetical protein